MSLDTDDQVVNTPADKHSPLQMSKEDILAKIKEFESHGERINELYKIIDHGDDSTKKHAWDILEDCYDDSSVKDGCIDGTDRLIKNKEHHRTVDFTSR